MDALILGESELCYWVVNCGKCYRTFFSEDCSGCTDIYFSKGLIGCNNCFGCVNLRNKSYHIFNEPYSKEEYERKIKEFKPGSFSVLTKLREEMYSFWKKFPQKFMHGFHNVNSSGDYVYECKNAHYMYEARYVEDGKFCQWMTLKPVKDVYDHTEWGNGVQRIYDSITVGEGANMIRFSFACWSTVSNIEYSMFCNASSDLFGCIGMRKKKYCILNREYPEDEYVKLREKIVQAMEERPYVDSKGRTWKYGEFFPYDLSLFDYNETSATQYYPLSKEQIMEKGWRWREPTPSEYQITMPPDKLPDSIDEVDEGILGEVLGCATCGKAFRLTPAEFALLRRFGFPLPRKCFDCRHMERLARLNPPQLWHRKCQCAASASENGVYTNTASHFHGNEHCPNEFETSYAPERPEIVYCESCYNSEVA